MLFVALQRGKISFKCSIFPVCNLFINPKILLRVVNVSNFLLFNFELKFSALSDQNVKLVVEMYTYFVPYFVYVNDTLLA